MGIIIYAANNRFVVLYAYIVQFNVKTDLIEKINQISFQELPKTKELSIVVIYRSIIAFIGLIIFDIAMCFYSSNILVIYLWLIVSLLYAQVDNIYQELKGIEELLPQKKE